MRTCILIILLFTSSTLFAQFRFGVNTKVYQSTGQFNDNMNRTPAGLSFSLLKQTSSRFSWGGELGVAMYSAGDYDYDLAPHGRPGQTIEVYEDNCFWTAHVLARHTIFRKAAIESYVEGRIGVTSFFTNQMALEDNPYFDSKTRVHGFAFNSGFGAGTSLNWGGIFSKDKELGKLWIDLGVNMNSGSNTEYRNAPAISQEYSLNEGVMESLTNYIGYRVGVMFDM